ncbi:MAG TPA: beta-propeller domain-containing protein [Nocardioides sp.]|uniref:beta-propeller domain-containing protein n=1 Tax=Nocardioides sp. TaxID=35761 RepID=UPI002E379BB8|nr:beta-propeller domain-containing protein [Nocardioides sp.]HEX5088364.1 beta-propeller domain-containing protein [Nocardioides sp.]
MPVRTVLSRTVLTRTLVSVGVVAGLGAGFVAGSSYAGPDGPRDQGRVVHRGGGGEARPAAYTGSGLSLPGSCDELLRWYVERGLELVGPDGWDGYGYPYAIEDAVPAPLASAESSAGRSPLAPAPVRSTNGETGTNVQEVGVDEPDVVKTDGRTLYRVQDGDLVLDDVSGAEVTRLASLDLPGALGTGDTEILLSGDTIVALSHRGSGAVTASATTEVASIDVSDPAHPDVTHTVDYDSDLVTARLQDGVVRVVLQAGLPRLDFVMPRRHLTEQEATEANREAVENSTIDDWLPHASVDGGEPEPVLGCDQVAIPDDDAALGAVAVVGFDASAPDNASATGLAADTDLVYVSTGQLYLATTPAYAPIRPCFECIEPQPMPESVPPSMPPGMLPSWLPGIGADRGPWRPPAGFTDGASHLYAFDLDGIDTTFAASGQVDGVIRDRWSMDAVDGPDGPVLRVVVGPTQNTGTFSSIVTFRQEGTDLVESGRLDDLGVGEDVQSVRWFDTLAILVTFRQVDPLYAVDLTDPAQPRLIGLLKIPGYSAYLHPLGRHRLLGLGQLQGGNGTWGAQAGLFDVTDLTHPRQLSVVKYGPGTDALATSDPRQLTWLPDGRTVLTVVAGYGPRGAVGYVSELTLGDGRLTNRMTEVEYGDEIDAVRLVPVDGGRVVLVTGDHASFFAL